MLVQIKHIRLGTWYLYIRTDMGNIFICHNIIFITPQIKVLQLYIKLQICSIIDIMIIFSIYM